MLIDPLRDMERGKTTLNKTTQCRFYAVLIMRGKVLGGMDPFLSILIGRKWIELRKISCPNVGFCVVPN